MNQHFTGFKCFQILLSQNLEAFFVGKYEVTNADFSRFVRESAAYDSLRGSWFRYSAGNMSPV